MLCCCSFPHIHCHQLSEFLAKSKTLLNGCKRLHFGKKNDLSDFLIEHICAYSYIDMALAQNVPSLSEISELLFIKFSPETLKLLK